MRFVLIMQKLWNNSILFISKIFAINEACFSINFNFYTHFLDLNVVSALFSNVPIHFFFYFFYTFILFLTLAICRFPQISTLHYKLFLRFLIGFFIHLIYYKNKKKIPNRVFPLSCSLSFLLQSLYFQSWIYSWFRQQKVTTFFHLLLE